MIIIIMIIINNYTIIFDFSIDFNNRNLFLQEIKVNVLNVYYIYDR